MDSLNSIAGITANTSPSAAQSATSAATSSSDALGSENTFLQLLVTQIKNQDPTQPVDSTTFLTQLASFSQLEQLIGIHQDIQNLNSASANAASGN